MRLKNTVYGPVPLIGFSEIVSVLSDDSDAALNLWRLRQLCEYCYKLALPFSDEQLEVAGKKFLACEAEVAGLPVSKALVAPLRKVLFELFPDVGRWKLEDILGVRETSGTFSGNPYPNLPIQEAKDRHDGLYPTDRVHYSGFYRSRKHDITLGSTAGASDDVGCSSTESAKDRPTSTPPGYWKRRSGHSGRQYFSGGIPAKACGRIRVRPVKLHLHAAGSGEFSRSSELLFVPKDSRGPRTIVREPLDSLRFQMGLHYHLREYLEGSTQGRIQFTDQRIFRRLARYASVNKKYATLDLKEASDRISNKLINRLFEGTAIATHLRHFRTKTVLIDGRMHTLSKLAGMGSGYTFPVLALLIYLVVIAEIGSRYKHDVYVYGDDLIVPAWAYDRVITRLSTFGLTVNRGKSYNNSAFRESCGGDYYNGVDVTPTRLSLAFCEFTSYGTKLNFSSRGYNSQLVLTKLERHCSELPWALNLTAHLYGWIEDHLGVSLPEKNVGSPILGRISLMTVTEDEPVGAYVPTAVTTELSDPRSLNRAFAAFCKRDEVTPLQLLLGDLPSSKIVDVSHRYKLDLTWTECPGVVRRTPP
jgi:hypothetical protein